MSNDTFAFEILCVDSENISKIQTVEQLLHSLMSNGDLWGSQAVKLNQLNLESTDLSVSVNVVDVKGPPDFQSQKAFRIDAKGKFAGLEAFRFPLVAHLRKHDIGLVYILWDEVSEEIACDIYPWVRGVENRLRGYLIKFFVTKLGPDWWKLTADVEMQKKAHQRRNNERVFSQHIDNKAYLIDFGEIGRIVYAQSSGFLDKEAIIDRVMKLEHTADAIARLQQELQSNYTKFFKETFKDKGFQDKWIQLEEIRHKVAHSNLFTIEDRTKADELTDSLYKIINEAERGIDAVVFSTGEQVAIQEAIIESLSQPSTPSYGSYTPNLYDPISEEELLRQLALQEQYSESTGGFVGLAHFVKVRLGNKAYDYATSYALIEDLERRGVLEVYDTYSSSGYPARAIRRIAGRRGINVDAVTEESQLDEEEKPTTNSEAIGG
jgi:hypothetical protein